MKRALFIILTDNSGGAERIATALANGLAKRRGWTSEFLVMAAQDHRSFVADVLADTVATRFGHFRRERFSFLLLPFYIIGRRYDLIFTTHVHTNAMLSTLRAVRAISVRRLVSRESTTVFDRFSGLRRMVFRVLYALYGAQDLIVAQTSYMADHVAPYMPGRARDTIRVIPNPVDLEAIMRQSAEPLSSDIAVRLEGRINVLFCGRLIDVKRPLVAIEAFAQARRAVGEHLQLVFVGEGPLKRDAQAAACELGLEHDVLFLGKQANPYPVMSACQYGLLSSSREGFPNVVLEMMACGMREVVMTPCAGDLDSLQQVRVSRDLTVEELGETLTKAVSSQENRAAMFREVVAERSVTRYLDEILGDVEA